MVSNLNIHIVASRLRLRVSRKSNLNVGMGEKKTLAQIKLYMPSDIGHIQTNQYQTIKLALAGLPFYDELDRTWFWDSLLNSFNLIFGAAAASTLLLRPQFLGCLFRNAPTAPR